MQTGTGKITGKIQALLLCATAAIWVAPAHADRDRTLDFQIAAGDLGSSLRAFGLRTGEQILFQEEMVAGQRAAGLSGSHGVAEALRMLLDGSGLTAMRTADGVMVLQRAAPERAGLTKASYQGEMAQALGAPGAPAVPPARAEAPDEPRSNEIIVTATRSATLLSKVPLSVSAITQEQMESRGVRDFSDVARLTPGINFSDAASGRNSVAIRGVASSAGASTTGIYIDETPIQVRQVGYTAGTVMPSLFDLDRVEVLRGPQGTLFGSGSQGGTVRFIQPAPGFTDYSGRARVEGSTIRGGGANYQMGAAVGGPIVADVLAFRASVDFRRKGGYIDRLEGHIVAPTQLPGEAVRSTFYRNAILGKENSIVFSQTGVAEENSNWTETTAARGALAMKPIENLTITASLNYQKQYLHDSIGSVYSALTDAQAGKFAVPVYRAGRSDDPATFGPDGKPRLTDVSIPDLNEGEDRMFLPYVAANWDNGLVSITSNTAWLSRRHHQVGDSTTGYGYSYNRWLVPFVGAKSASWFVDTQENFTQELRVQSADPDTRLRWLVGGFYSNNRQNSTETISTNFLERATELFGDSPIDRPFPGAGVFLNTFGDFMLPNSVHYIADTTALEKQYAAFAQLDFKVTPELTLTVGGRFARNELTADIFQDGAENNLNAPYGYPCVDFETEEPLPGGCAVGQPPFQPVYGVDVVSNRENVFTPKFSIAWQKDSDNLFYATVAKGFRPGGAQVGLPNACNPGLELIGFVDSNGQAYSPTSYKSDSVWSYEAGSKNRMLNGALSFDGSVYLIKWNQIQTNLTIQECGYAMVANLGKATSKGFDASFALQPTDRLNLSAAIGYNNTRFDVTTTVFRKGDYVPGTGNPFTVYLSGEYTIPFGEDDREAYVRGDWTYGSHPRRTGNVNPNSPDYNPLNMGAPAQSILNARIGARMMGMDLSLFANNLLNFNKPLGYSTGSFNQSRKQVSNPIYTESYVQPRTIGATAAYRF